MSETPSRKPRHALSDTGPSVPVQHGPWDGPGAGTGADATPRASVPEQAAAPDVAPVDGPHTAAAPDGAPLDGPHPAAVPQPSPAGDELFADREAPHAPDGGPGAPAPERADLPADPGDAPTQALPVIPRPRTDGDPSVARLPEPFRPGPVQGTAGRPTGVPGLPELPSKVRPVLPAALGAATALLLTLGVVAGVNGAPDPAPAPPAPVSEP
ncbi:hypothetical protein [Pseudonocardia sp. NPDC046786]|uniref:hypothetical protein n=1 Tax=Pseudonocardia sp. NPDC046786 TaxID=3155471 RepID=UPI00340229CB